MKFSLADPGDGYTIRAYSRTEIVVGDQRLTSSLILAPDRIVPDWGPETHEQITASAFQVVLDMKPDLILLGTGDNQHFPRAEVYQAVSEARLGLEVMTTPAACRTYNILVSEGRRVLAALLLSP